MGRQIQHFLSTDDEQRLVEHLRLKFPVVVADSVYPASWKRRKLERSRDAEAWIIADERAVSILLGAAWRLSAEHPVESRGWRITSAARSCVDWTRGSQGRLYLNTMPDPIGDKVFAVAGDDVERMYERACRWLKSSCSCGDASRTGRWVSRDLVPAYEKLQQEAEARRSARPKDPRDDRFYELRRKAKRLLTERDKATLIRYCDAMIAYVGADSAESWMRYRNELTGTPGP